MILKKIHFQRRQHSFGVHIYIYIYIYIYLDGPPLIIRSRVNAPLPSLRAGPARPPSIFCRRGGTYTKDAGAMFFAPIGKNAYFFSNLGNLLRAVSSLVLVACGCFERGARWGLHVKLSTCSYAASLSPLLAACSSQGRFQIVTREGIGGLWLL
jgi:hypothetical protein